MIIIAVAQELENSKRQVHIAQWLDFLMSTENLKFRAFQSYNPYFPQITGKAITFGDIK